MPYANEDLAYIAGVIDSDGYIGMRKVTERRRAGVSESYCPTISISQCKKDAIHLIHDLFGGRIYELQMPENKNWNTLYRLMIYRRKEIEIFLTAILPFLRIKRRQAEHVLSFLILRAGKLKVKRCSKNTYSEKEREIWLTVKALNQTGKEVHHSVRN